MRVRLSSDHRRLLRTIVWAGWSALAAATVWVVPAGAAAQGAACSRPNAVDAAITARHGLFGVTIYYSGQAKNNLSAAFGKHLAAYASDIRFRDRNAAALPPSAESEVFFLNASDVAKDAPPPTADSLRYFGRGLSQEQAAALATSKAASLIGFRLAPKNLWRDLRTAHRAIMAFAEETGGYIWDG